MTRRLVLVGVVGLLLLVGGVALANSVTSPDTAGDVGQYPSLALDAAGNPVVGYYDASNTALKVLHCNDARCAGSNESITSPDTAGDVGADAALALDGSGFAVIAYSAEGDLVVMHCNDANCAGGDESITTPDSDGEVGDFKSLALDAAGNPVVSYYDATNGALKVLHCNDRNCEGEDESVTTPDSGDVGMDTSLALDAAGNPVISYYDLGNDTLKVMHCNDANCAGNNESITTPDGSGVGGYTSLALDGNGFPVISYFDWDNGTLKVLHCNDASCAGNNESITSPDAASGVGAGTSLALDGDGNPVVAYYDAGNESLKLMVCNDANCAGDDEHIITADGAAAVGEYLSLVLDADGDPAIAYYDATNGDLKVLRCTNPLCEPNVAPSANAGPDQTGRQWAPVSFAGSAGDANGDVLRYAWDFGDGETAQGTLTPTHVYDAMGVFTVTLTVTDEGGLTASDTLTVTVEEGDARVFLPVFWR